MTLSIPPLALALVLCAAVLHALWNALVKGAADRALMMALISLGHGVLGALMVMRFGHPLQESWPFIALSTFIHFFYYGFLIIAYRFGDLSQVYPVARGSAPLLVAFGAVIFAGENLRPLAWAGTLSISFGIALLALGNTSGSTSRTAILAALGTGLTIAAYTLADGLGARASQNPLGYIGWLFLLECIAGFGLLYIRRKHLGAATFKHLTLGLAGGVLSALAYGMAIYAKTLTELGAVSALRESSVIIAALIGAIWFNERPWKLRVVAAAIVAAGVILIAFA